MRAYALARKHSCHKHAHITYMPTHTQTYKHTHRHSNTRIRTRTCTHGDLQHAHRHTPNSSHACAFTRTISVTAIIEMSHATKARWMSMAPLTSPRSDQSASKLLRQHCAQGSLLFNSLRPNLPSPRMGFDLFPELIIVF